MSSVMKLKLCVLSVLAIHAFSGMAFANDKNLTDGQEASMNYVFGLVYKANKEVQHPQVFNTVPQCTTGCEAPKPAAINKDVRCNDANNYLENKFELLGGGNNVIASILANSSDNHPVIRSECVRISQETVFSEKSTSFRSCDAAGKVQKAKRACVSDTYENLVTKSFSIVSQCLGGFSGNVSSDEEIKSDTGAFYSMLSLESGLHVNAMSHSGAAGIGQNTRDNISYMNDYRMNKTADLMKNSNLPQCQQLGTALDDSSNWMRPNVTCDQIGVSNGNPLLGMIYSHMSLKFTAADIDKKIFSTSPYAAKLKMSDAEKRKLLRGLAIWSHNTGAAGIKVPLRALIMNESKKVGSFTSADSILSKMQAYVRNHPAGANSGPQRRIETSSYYPKMLKNLERTEKLSGGKACII